MSWKDFYKKVTNPFGASGKFYTGGHHGVDFAAASHAKVPSYFSGVCVLNGHSSVLGNYTVFRDDADGSYIGYAHCLIGTRPNVGTKVKPGDTLYLAAGPKDDHGSAWSGPHCHTTRSPHDINGVWDGNVIDPWPAIKRAIGASAANTPSKSVEWKYVEPSKKTQLRVQKALAKRGRYSGKQDGDFGPLTIKGVQTTLRGSMGWKGNIDGTISSRDECVAIQQYAKKFGSYTGPVDGILGEKSWSGFALGLERP